MNYLVSQEWAKTFRYVVNPKAIKEKNDKLEKIFKFPYVKATVSKGKR